MEYVDNEVVDLGEKEVEDKKIDFDKIEEEAENLKKQLEESNGMDRTINGQCSGCGRCCQATLPLSEKEIQKIKSYIGKHKIKPINRHNVLDTEFINICPFLDENKKCMIYPVRPEICRWFICSRFRSMKQDFFNHTNKTIVNMYSVFMKGTSYPAPTTNILKLNADYTAQKKKMFNIYFDKRH